MPLIFAKHPISTSPVIRYLIGYRYQLILLLGLLFVAAGSYGQQGTDLYFEHLNYEEGFSPSMISSIIQDEKGFIWLGTEGGLLRYDGYNFIRYSRDKNVAGSISNNHVNIIYEDSESSLWIGTSNGVNHFNTDTKAFTPIDILPIKGGRNYITSFAEDASHTIWIGTFGGVKRLNKEKKLLEKVPTDATSELFSSDRVLSLFFDNKLGVLVGTATGLKIFDPATGKVKELPAILNKNSSFNSAKIWKIVQQENGDLWFATKSEGAFLYSPERNTLQNYTHDVNDRTSISSNWIYDILPVDPQTVWFATVDGVCVFRKDLNKFSRQQHNPFNTHSISDNEIKSLLKDSNGSIWIGTSVGGLNFFNQANNNFINIGESVMSNFGLTNPIVNSLLIDENQKLWAATNGGGLNLLDLRNNTATSFEITGYKKSSNMMSMIAYQGKDKILCGTEIGLFSFDKLTKTFRQIPLSNHDTTTKEYAVTSLKVDNQDIWVGTEGEGLIHIEPNQDITTFTTRVENTISDNFITDIENAGDYLWIATQDGLNMIDKSVNRITKIYRSGEKGSISNNNLTTLFSDSRGRLWVGTDYGGLNYFDQQSQTFYFISKADGLTDNSIKSISEDTEGNIWVSSGATLYKIVFDEGIGAKGRLTYKITYYSSNNGLSFGQFSNNCSLSLGDNRLAFGTSKGIILFHPDRISQNPAVNEITLSKLKIHNKEVNPGDNGSPLTQDISLTDEITLNHSQGYLEIEFSAMNFVNPKLNLYAYKLESGYIKDDWHIIGNQNSVNLTGLQPGTYVFSVKTSSEGSSWDTRIRSLKIVVLPPWWLSWWAYLLYSIITLLIAFTVYHFIRNRVQLKRALFVEQVEKERQQELYRMKMDFFTNVSHEIRTPLSLMIAPIEDMLEIVEKNTRMESRLKTINNNTQRLHKLVNELLDFRKAENGLMKIHCKKQDLVSFCFDAYESFKELASNKNIEYKFVIDSQSIPVFFDRYQMEKVLFNILSNAFKFTKENGKIVLTVEGGDLKDGWVQIKVKDNGIGIPDHIRKNIFQRFFQIEDPKIQSSGTGVGLALSKAIIELHKGEIGILDKKDSWATTVFQISLRMGSDHFSVSQLAEHDVNIHNQFLDKLDAFIPEKEPQTDHLVEEDPFLSSIYTVDTSKKTVMIVEDNDEFRRFIKDVLLDDYNIVDFGLAKDAIKYMEEQIPDLVISDVIMPEMTGLELCEYIKTNESTNHLPVILLTAKSSTDSEIEGLTTGADSYIAKPFSIKVLKLNILNLLSAKEILRQKYSGNFIIDSDLKKLSTPEELFIKKLMEQIESNLENPDFNVNDLVRGLGMSRTVLYQKVNMLTQHSIATLIKHVRIKKAADILLNTSYNVSEVAYMVGFNDRKYFSREFRKVYQVSPSEYKTSRVPAKS